MKSQELDSILNSLNGYIWDYPWNEFNSDWVKDYLNDEYPDLEYKEEEITYILSELKYTQKAAQREALRQNIQDFICKYDIHLDSDEIGKILVNLANIYFGYE